MVPEIWCMTDGQTDEQMEKVTYKGGCPNLKKTFHRSLDCKVRFCDIVKQNASKIIYFEQK